MVMAAPRFADVRLRGGDGDMEDHKMMGAMFFLVFLAGTTVGFIGASYHITTGR
jgi:hypothetical protein